MRKSDSGGDVMTEMFPLDDGVAYDYRCGRCLSVMRLGMPRDPAGSYCPAGHRYGYGIYVPTAWETLSPEDIRKRIGRTPASMSGKVFTETSLCA